MHFGFLDIILVIPFLWAIFRGFTKGFVRQLASLGALILGIYGATKLSGLAGGYISKKFEVAEKLANYTSFVIIFILILILVYFISKMVQDAIKSTPAGPIDKILGVLFAVLKTTLIVGVFLTLFEVVNRKLDLVEQRETEKSFLYKPLAGVVPFVFPSMRFEMREKPTLEDIKEKLKK